MKQAVVWVVERKCPDGWNFYDSVKTREAARWIAQRARWDYRYSVRVVKYVRAA